MCFVARIVLKQDDVDKQAMDAEEGDYVEETLTASDAKERSKFPDFFKRHKLRKTQHIISAHHQHILKWLHLHPRKLVLFDEDVNGYFIFHSRAHRKNRYMEFHPKQEEKVVLIPSMPTILKLDWRNISWHVALYFCLGSICWIVNGQYALRQNDSSYVINAIGYSGFSGGMLFWIGAYLAVVEALNTNENYCFGAEMANLAHHILSNKRLHYKHYHINRIRKLRRRDHARLTNYDAPSTNNVHQWISMKPCTQQVKWRWIGYSPTIGFWATLLQFIGATFFAVAVISGIPGVIGATEWQLQQTFIWTMQTVGSVFFVISSWISMVEEQENWYMPACGKVGWHSAFWNLLGSIGFLLSAVFGYLANWKGKGAVCCQLWGTAFNTYWGSWAFMISSALLYYEVQNKQPSSFSNNASLIKSWVMFKGHTLFSLNKRYSPEKANFTYGI